jgi:DNA segregation ATPase FtsK/SpoIIIE, S-DNA-T family
LFAIPGPRPAWLIALVAGAAVASVVAGLALRLVERRSARRARRRERSRYLAHLERIAIQANQLAAAQLAVAEHLHPDLPRLWATIDRTTRLWERRPSDADFLTVRVGRAPSPSPPQPGSTPPAAHWSSTTPSSSKRQWTSSAEQAGSPTPR